MSAAGIVLYNPDIERLIQNIESINLQVNELIIVDNGSSNIMDIELILMKYSNVVLIKNNKNYGIARALNQIVERAKQLGSKWVLTLDQDSVTGDKIIEQYEAYTNFTNVASLTCLITDRNFDYQNIANDDNNSAEVDFCITSGNYIRISTWEQLGGFDETFFIDKVDTDYCYRIRQNGWIIKQIPYKGLLHEVGTNTKKITVFGKQIIVFNHSPFRCYYLIRNQIYFARKHLNTLGKKRYHRYVRTAWTRIFVYLIWEKNKIKKFKAWIMGLFDGYRLKIKDYDDN